MRYIVNVYQDATRETKAYSVPADSEDDARLMAFILDGGIEPGKIGVGSTIEDGELELAKTYTEVIGVIVPYSGGYTPLSASAHFGRSQFIGGQDLDN